MVFQKEGSKKRLPAGRLRSIQGTEIIIGKNLYEYDQSQSLDLLKIDNEAVRDAQIKKLNAVKASRDVKSVEKALKDVAEAAQNNHLNLLDACVSAARVRATLGEISLAIEKVFGRYQPDNSVISGVYAAEMSKSKDFQKAIDTSDAFAQKYGRRPRIMVAKLGQDGHDRGARVIATSFADIGFDVDVGPLFQTPEEAALQAAENDVHFLGISSMTGGHNTLVPQTIKALQKLGRPDIRIVLGGIIPVDEYTALKKMGVFAIFGPGTNIPLAAIELLEKYSEGL